MTQEEVLTIEETAALLKVSETTVYQLTRGGELPARKVGREWRFLRTKLIDWLDQGGTGMEQAGVVGQDKHGGEYRVEDGVEKVALWLELTREEKDRLVEKAVAAGVMPATRVAQELRRWLETDEVPGWLRGETA